MPRDERTFITVLDKMPEHPKIEPLSDAAFRLLVETWCWCARLETDGHVPERIWTKRGTTRARRELADAGLVEPTETGIYMHDYLEHQRSAAEIKERRERLREAGRKGGLARADARANGRQSSGKRQASAKATAKQTASDGQASAKATAKQTLKRNASETQADTDTDKQITTLTEDLEPKGSISSSWPRKRGVRKRDPHFEALIEACGVNASELTDIGRGAINRALKAIRDVGATPEDITERARRYVKKFPNASLTAPALAKHWASLTEAEPEPWWTYPEVDHEW